jgi:CMP-N-acetylneuraminic acid synthetase
MKKITEKILAVIPARGGSKGLPGKNITELNGKPLIAWTIDAALQSEFIDKVFVSTDDKKIADIASSYGAEVPWLRPEHLASDDASIIDALVYDIEKYKEENNFSPDYIVLLQPTSPLRKSYDIDNAFKLLREKNTSSVVSISEVREHPYIMKTLTEDGTVKDFMDNLLPPEKMNRQNFPDVYVLNGAIYIISTAIFQKVRTFVTDDTVAYKMPYERSVDIDNKFDLQLAEFFMRLNNE